MAADDGGDAEGDGGVLSGSRRSIGRTNGRT